jgi:hypothetical protein
MTTALFLETNAALIQSIVLKSDQIKREEAILKNLKAELQAELVAAGLTRAANENYKITLIGETLSTGIDARKLEKTEPELYVRLLGDYLKINPRSSYVKVEVLP